MLKLNSKLKIIKPQTQTHNQVKTIIYQSIKGKYIKSKTKSKRKQTKSKSKYKKLKEK